MKSIFDSYSPTVREYIYANRWENLRSVQVAAGSVILHTDQNLLLTASTASGKTEAAFFPIISLFEENMPKSVGCIYIGPLKALINDQFQRLTPLCERAHIPLWHWHGDVGSNHKEKLIKNPSGILQITPESLEALLLRKSNIVNHLFKDLRFIVIDEVHSLLRGERGAQTLCLIERLSSLAHINPRRIGLSATIGEPEETGNLLSRGTGRQTLIPQTTDGGSKWRLSVEHFYIESKPEDPKEKKVIPIEQAPLNSDPGFAYVYNNTYGKKCIVFVNSREECEVVTASLRQYCSMNDQPDRFLIHHGNLSAALRIGAEEQMKDEEQTKTVITTSTLELGIDIGRLEKAFQLDAPWTVASFLQRMGRTGRRGDPQEMRFVIREDKAASRDMLPNEIPWKLIQAIALIELYIGEKWVEPAELNKYHYSLLYHQSLSVLASMGEMSPAALAEKILTLSFFKNISQEDYRILLKHLIASDHIQQTEKGGLIVGLAGERIINNFRFYGVFKESEEYTVRSEETELGTIAYAPSVNDKIAIAGRVWIVTEIDYKKKNIYCELVKGIVPAYFGDCAGSLHTKILRKMRDVLESNEIYPYVMSTGAKRLEQARALTKNTGFTRLSLINLGENTWAFFPWLGTYAFITLERILKIKCAKALKLKGLDPARPFFMTFTMDADRQTFFKVLKKETEKITDPMELVYEKENPVFEKYDEYLPSSLVRKGFALGILDLAQVKEAVYNMQV